MHDCELIREDIDVIVERIRSAFADYTWERAREVARIALDSFPAILNVTAQIADRDWEIKEWLRDIISATEPLHNLNNFPQSMSPLAVRMSLLPFLICYKEYMIDRELSYSVEESRLWVDSNFMGMNWHAALVNFSPEQLFAVSGYIQHRAAHSDAYGIESWVQFWHKVWAWGAAQD